MANRGGLEVPLLGFAVGGVFLLSAFKGKSVTDTLAGVQGSSLDPSGHGYKSKGTSTNTDVATASSAPSGVSGSGTPKSIIDTKVLPIAARHGINRSVAQNDAANKAHGATVDGGRSDHQGPPNVAWAADMSNGSSPTPQMDALAKDLAQTFGIKWSGSGLANATHDGYRYQLIYRTFIGGNHFNHVHFGVRKV